jgi:23S rRNA (cytidine1920-2'-O)/16S rRNA (cytidine1409-2'-O)-methyltransferase
MDERERRHDARRLDALVAETTGLTRSQARALIVAGKVRVDGDPATKPGTGVRAGAHVVVAEPPRYVSRGGEKLEGALRAFGIDVTGLDVLDVGASTGGFTDALLQHGARAVTALDVGYGQLAWKLRGDPRVRVIERTNVRTLPADAFPDGFDLIVIDASFISLRTIVARAAAFLRDGGAIVALVKPQFEAGRERIGGGGVVRDPAVHAAVLREVRDAVHATGLRVVAAALSPLRGPAGNVEFFYELRRAGEDVGDARLDALVASAHAEQPAE